MNFIRSVFASLSLGRGSQIALLTTLLAAAFDSSPLSASTLLGTAQLNGDTLAKTCFDNDCTQQEVVSGNASTVSPDSSAQTTTTPSTAPSVSSRSEADILPAGGSAPNSFTSIAKAQASINYFFEIVGPQNMSIPVLISANGNISVTGNFASTGYLEYLAEARLIIPVANQDISFDENVPSTTNGTASNSFDISGTYNLQTNTAYQVLMQVSTGVDLNEQVTTTALADLIATASIDPSFQIGSGFSDYSIVYSDGIGNSPSTTPLPATLPLFAGGLGFLGYLARHRRNAKQALAGG